MLSFDTHNTDDNWHKTLKSRPENQNNKQKLPESLGWAEENNRGGDNSHCTAI